jgi:hypothetical protein
MLHLATDRGMNDGLNGLRRDARLVSAASAMLEALKYADRGLPGRELALASRSQKSS